MRVLPDKWQDLTLIPAQIIIKLRKFTKKRRIYMKKKILAVLLALVVTVGVLPATVFAISNEGPCGDNATWFYSNGTLTISGSGDMRNYDNESKKPLWLQYYAEDIKKVEISDKITSIGDYAFYNCKNVEKLSIPSSVKSIGDFAFAHWDSTTSVKIPSSVKKMGQNAFYGCENLETVEIASGITSIEAHTFAACTNLTKVVIPSSVKSLGDYAFDFCSSLEELEIPISVTKIGYRTFYDCQNLKTLFYGGSEDDWAKVTFEKDNFPLEKVKFHENSKTTGKAGDSDTKLKVVVNGTALSTDQPPVIVEGRTLVPLRAIFEALGASVDWNNEEKRVTSEKGGDKVTLVIGERRLHKNDKEIPLDVPAQIVNSRTMVPARAVSEALGCKVNWDGNTKTVTITG